MDDLDDDPVEFEVNLADVGQLMVMLQYPLRTIDRPYGDQGPLKKVSVKTQNNKIFMTYGIDKDTENYDENASNNRITQHKLSSTYW